MNSRVSALSIQAAYRILGCSAVISLRFDIATHAAPCVIKASVQETAGVTPGRRGSSGNHGSIDPQRLPLGVVLQSRHSSNLPGAERSTWRGGRRGS